MKLVKHLTLPRQDDLWANGEPDNVYFDRQVSVQDDTFVTDDIEYSDITSIINWDACGLKHLMPSEVRLEIQKLFVNAFSSYTNAEKKVLSKWFVANKADRDTVHNSSEQTNNSKELYSFLQVEAASKVLTDTADKISAEANAAAITTVVEAEKKTVPYKSYTHTQTEASSLWVIEHNLNRFPSAVFVDNDGNAFVCDFKYINDKKIEAYPSPATTGKAYIN